MTRISLNHAVASSAIEKERMYGMLAVGTTNRLDLFRIVSCPLKLFVASYNDRNMYNST